MTIFVKSYLLPLISVLTGAVILFALFAPLSTVDAQSKNEVIKGLNASNQSGGESQIQQVVAAALNLFSIIIGVAGVVFVMVAGFKYLASSGDASQVAGAQRALFYALVGLSVAALAQIIVRFVLGRVVN